MSSFYSFLCWKCQYGALLLLISFNKSFQWNEKICCEWKKQEKSLQHKNLWLIVSLVMLLSLFRHKTYTHTHISIPLLAFIMQLNSCRKAGCIELIFPCRYYINVGEKEKSIILTQYTRLNEFVCTCAHVCVGV